MLSTTFTTEQVLTLFFLQISSAAAVSAQGNINNVVSTHLTIDFHKNLNRYSKIHNGILGLVLEIHENGELITHDFFVLSRLGKKNLEFVIWGQSNFVNNKVLLCRVQKC